MVEDEAGDEVVAASLEVGGRPDRCERLLPFLEGMVEPLEFELEVSHASG